MDKLRLWSFAKDAWPAAILDKLMFSVKQAFKNPHASQCLHQNCRLTGTLMKKQTVQIIWCFVKYCREKGKSCSHWEQENIRDFFIFYFWTHLKKLWAVIFSSWSRGLGMLAFTHHLIQRALWSGSLSRGTSWTFLIMPWTATVHSVVHHCCPSKSGLILIMVYVLAKSES